MRCTVRPPHNPDCIHEKQGTEMELVCLDMEVKSFAQKENRAE